MVETTQGKPSPQDARRALGAAAARRRQDLHWSRQRLADEAGTTTNSIRAFELGDRRTRAETKRRILAALTTTADKLLAPPPTAKDPRVEGLRTEDLAIARAFHDSDTETRLFIRHALRDEHVGRFLEHVYRVIARLGFADDMMAIATELLDTFATTHTTGTHPVAAPTRESAPFPLPLSLKSKA